MFDSAGWGFVAIDGEDVDLTEEPAQWLELEETFLGHKGNLMRIGLEGNKQGVSQRPVGCGNNVGLIFRKIFQALHDFTAID